jgi:hypothetical protein
VTNDDELLGGRKVSIDESAFVVHLVAEPRGEERPWAKRKTILIMSWTNWNKTLHQSQRVTSNLGLKT